MNATATQAGRSRFLDVQALAATAHLRFATRHQIEGAYSGRHRSKQQGGAGEFVDYREYVEGEDLRRLDWKVLARTGRAYTRLYQDETNLMCMLALDASGSMLFGGNGSEEGSKLEYAQYLATALSHIIARQQDQAGVSIIAEGLDYFLPTGSTSDHVSQIHHAIENVRTRPMSNLGQGLRELFDRLHRRGVLLVMSDFLVDDLERTFASIRLFRHRRWEVVILHIVHPDEERLPDGVAYRFEGMENDGRADCSPMDIRSAYEKRFAHHAATVRTMSLVAGCDYRRASTAIPYMQTIGGFLVERTG